MRVTHVAICPTAASTRAGRPALTPELLAATGARYSRNNEGLEAILAKIDPRQPDQAVDAIFRMVDYGHQSIADLVPVAMFIDGLSLWLAYYLWSLCPTASGQESSTRYLKVSSEGLVPAQALGITDAPAWRQSMEQCFQAYQTALKLWEDLAAREPAVMGLPQALLADAAAAARKKVQRLKRNYAFDRARYFLPAAAATNVMLLMSARGWITLCQYLLSHSLPEARRLGERLRAELELCAPRLLKHARPLEPAARAIAREFDKVVALARREVPAALAPDAPAQAGESAIPFVLAVAPPGISPEETTQDLAYHENRYAPVGSSLQRTSVRFGWSAIAFAEIRDLNRHRTGAKYCPQAPRGFYCALDQVPAPAAEHREQAATLAQLAAIGRRASAQAASLLCAADPTYVYWTLLGTEYPFEHTTTADKFIYEAELRTGLGAHFRYAKHLRDALALFYRQFPATQGLILEGRAEPE